ncbi:MAG: M28 family peptidase, partial [Anaerolineales bacterium]
MILLSLIVLISFSAGCAFLDLTPRSISDDSIYFQAERAYQDLAYQVDLGPRIPGTPGHEQIRIWITENLEESGWIVEEQLAEIAGFQVRNLIAYREEAPEYILLGAHYDTRIMADHDPDQSMRDQPVPGANDGASGVAVLLELARVLPKDLSIPVKLVFFDAEDNGGIGEWDWILGSRAFVRDLEDPPQAAVIVDMVGDDSLEIYFEGNSDPAIREGIWRQARELGYGNVFIT